MPKEKRSRPPIGSIPTVERIRPAIIMIRDRIRDVPVRLDRRTTPRTVRAKYSAGPKARAAPIR
ncbi:MAG: hypothetical protein V1766_15025 [Pseudomonadota bacterium]